MIEPPEDPLRAADPLAGAIAPAAVAPIAAPKRGSTGLADLIGVVVGSQVVTTVIGQLQSILLVRLLAKDDYGTYQFVLSVLFATGRDLGSLGIPESILYFEPKVRPPALKGLIRQSMGLLAGLGGLVALIFASLGFAPSHFLDGRHGLFGMLLIIAGASIIGFPAAVFPNLFIASNNARASAGISMVMTILGTAGTLVPAALGWPVWTIVAFFAMNMGIRLLLSELVFRRLFPGPTEPFPGGVRAQMAYVWPLSVTRFAGVFNQKLDKFLVGLFFSAGQFAEFAVGAQELPLVSILPYSVASTMLPKLVELYEAGADRIAGARRSVELWHAGIKKTSLVMLPIAAFLLIAAEPIMVLLYGERYRGAALPFRIYSALLPLRVTSYGIMLNAFGRTTAILRVQVAGMAVNVALSVVLLWKVGMVGAPLSAVITQALMIVALLATINTIAKVGLGGIFPWRHYGKVAIATLIAGAPLLAAHLLLPRLHPAIFLGAGAPVFLAVYLRVAIALGTMGPEDRAYVGRWLRLEPLRSKKTPDA